MSRSPHRGAAALVALVATAAAAGGAFAQSTRQVALGLAREPFAVVWDAERQRPVLAGRDATAEAFARLWIVGPGFSVEEVLLEGPPDSTLAEARAVAAQARWVAGRTNVEAGPDLRAVRWRNGQWLEPELPPLPDGATRSVANGVSDAGALAGTADGALPFVWNEAAGVRILRPPPGGLPFGRVEWLAPDGASAAGAAVDGEGNERAARWPGLDAPAVRLDDPFGIGSVAFGGSADGRHFAGDVADAGGLRAAVWLDGRLHLPLDGSGLPLRGARAGSASTARPGGPRGSTACSGHSSGTRPGATRRGPSPTGTSRAAARRSPRRGSRRPTSPPRAVATTSPCARRAAATTRRCRRSRPGPGRSAGCASRRTARCAGTRRPRIPSSTR